MVDGGSGAERSREEGEGEIRLVGEPEVGDVKPVHDDLVIELFQRQQQARAELQVCLVLAWCGACLHVCVYVCARAHVGVCGIELAQEER